MIACRVPAASDAFNLAGTVVEGKYRVDRLVAEGGFGVVYSGYHLRLDVPLAIKVLKPNRSQSAEARADTVSRFLVEARTTARLSHQNIGRAIDTGVLHSEQHSEGLPWLALEWLDGRTLETELAARRGQGGRSPNETLELLAPVLDAIDYAHRQGIAHRDLKPSNIMLVEERGRIIPKVLDFGIAKAVEVPAAPGSGQTATESTVIAFSPGYAAPEQVAMTRTGPWTDVHALALLLIEVMSDRPVYGASDSMPILAEILATERPTPSRRGLNVGPWEEILARAVALSPSERQASAGALLEELMATRALAEQHWREHSAPLSGKGSVLRSSIVNGVQTTVPSNWEGSSATLPTSSVEPSAPPSVSPPPQRRVLGAVAGLGVLALIIAIGVHYSPSVSVRASAASGAMLGPAVSERPALVTPTPAPPAAVPEPRPSASSVPTSSASPSAVKVKPHPAIPASSRPPKPAVPRGLAPAQAFE